MDARARPAMYAKLPFETSWSDNARASIVRNANAEVRRKPVRKNLLAILAALALAIAPSIAGSADLDWNKLDAEALGYFQTYLRFDTTNPPDQTVDAIAYLKQILDKEGIETQVFVSKPGMANLVARL